MKSGCEYYVRGRNGGYCHQRMVNGIVSSSDFRVGAWEQPLDYFSEDTDLQHVSIDSTIIRAHALCDALSMPIKFIPTGGQEVECKQAIPLLKNVNVSAVLADNTYDTNALRKLVKRTWNKSRHSAKIEQERRN